VLGEIILQWHMDKLNLTFKEGDVLYASQLTTIV
jgi:hypothetical protein